mmetsp:Transcript_42878/g.93289  ORF Transcript_42878/g.93289 Transcript_42878/m.93289 type:complete len:453 (+) Transcript_42878:87-1445(+)
MAGLCRGGRGVVLVTCLGAYFLSMAMIYQMSPFFEVYARKSCGASSLTVGFIFAAMPMSSFVGNLGMDGMIRRFGVEVMMNVGLILLAASFLGFGLSQNVTGWLCWRSMQGFATAPIYTSISTRLARTFTGEGEFHRVVGLQEVCGNVGVTLGPLLGGMLFQYGGFSLPFIVSAGLHLLFVGISLLSICCKETKSGSEEAEPSDAHGLEAGPISEDPTVTICSVATVRLLLLSGISTLCLGVWGAFEPLLADHFVKILGHIDHTFIGFLMSLSAVPSTFAAMAVPSLLRCVRAKWLMAGGLVIYGFGSFSMGSWELLSPWASQIGGLLLIGCGWGLCWTPVLPSMVEAAVAQLKDTPADQGRHAVSPAVSSVFNASAALGEAVGPLMGTWLLPKNFQLGPKVIAIFLVVYAACTYFSDPGSEKGIELQTEQLPTQTRLRSVLPNPENPELEG